MPPMSKPLVEENEPKFEWVQIEGCETLLVHLTEDCDVNGITAKFEGGVLKIKLPKVVGSALHKEEQKQDIKNTSAPSTVENEKLSSKDGPLAKDHERGKLSDKPEGEAVDGKEAKDEKQETVEKYKKRLEGKSRTKKVILLVVLILGVGVALGIRALQSKGSVRQFVNDMWGVK